MFFFKRKKRKRRSIRDPIEQTVAVTPKLQESRHMRAQSLRTRIIITLAIIVLLQTVLLIYGVSRYSQSEKERIQLDQIEKKHSSELEILRPQLEQMQHEMANLVLAQQPDLQRIELDRIVSLDVGYVKNITISAVEKNGGKTVEYRVNLMVRNYDFGRLRVNASVLFFNRSGQQIAQVRFGVNEDGSPSEDVLENGETRSFFQKTEFKTGEEPLFFRIDLVK